MVVHPFPSMASENIRRTDFTSRLGPCTKITRSVVRFLYSPDFITCFGFPFAESIILLYPYPDCPPTQYPSRTIRDLPRCTLSLNSRLNSAAMLLLRAFRRALVAVP